LAGEGTKKDKKGRKGKDIAFEEEEEREKFGERFQKALREGEIEKHISELGKKEILISDGHEKVRSIRPYGQRREGGKPERGGNEGGKTSRDTARKTNASLGKGGTSPKQGMDDKRLKYRGGLAKLIGPIGTKESEGGDGKSIRWRKEGVS